MSRSLTAWSRWVSPAERSRSSFAYNFLCAGSPSVIFGDADDDCQWMSRLLSARFRTGARRRCRAAEGGLHL
jgi:hypothetical protein